MFSTRRLFEQVARRNERVAVDIGVAFDIQVADEADQVYADPHRLEQAVDNLVANALRYTPSGGRVSMRADMAGDTVALKVVDTGPGIPAEHIGHVFDRFYKADPSRAATREGSGLGLSIVRAIVERHGGTVGRDQRARPHRVHAAAARRCHGGRLRPSLLRRSLGSRTTRDAAQARLPAAGSLGYLRSCVVGSCVPALLSSCLCLRSCGPRAIWTRRRRA